ncbi:conserved hypothetical protein [Nostocoides japonicum T1-X7]|uniref:Endonuclease/exonuclease/phosphatase domain-containing protein n=1 Tax=Nostocoides japonicum T1-X7 TaxID=1194083 RepID=A0A077M0R1_9MICO|nr:endonuclease/exonuclease/phosphatase family protein [Tetrasphaera japonica]CCH77779.1 conserved hypothetical protein [Tetrasphaera japonica T1-X7]
MTRLRVASYNTRDFLDDRAAAAAVVRALDPDVLCLQEVPRRLFATTRVATFAAQCRLYWGGHHRGSGGTTILTSLRTDVAASAHHRLRVHWPDRTRGYATVRLRLPDGRDLVVASVHLGLRPDERAEHAGSIVRALGRTERAVVCGDLNEEAGPASDVLRRAGLGPVSPPEPTFPARSPRRRLDVVLATPDLAVLPHVAVDLPAADLVRASDHRPVWVDLDV